MKDKNRAMMELAAAAHALNMAIYLLGESVEENKEHGYDDYIRMAKESVARAETVE
jgi:hypothetical protein